MILGKANLKRAYFTPYGVGLGHASRTLMIAEKMQSEGVNVRFSSFGEASRYISMHGYKCHTVPPVEFAWSMEGGFSVKYSLAHIPMWFANFSRQVNTEAGQMLSFIPDIVVSDSRLSPLVTAKMLGIPSIVILNQAKLLLSPRLREFRIARFFEKMNGEFLGVLWTAADRILVPDLPPPYTVSEHNLWDISSITGKLEYVGFTSPVPHVTGEQITKVANTLGFARTKPIIFVHISGPVQTRVPLIRTALQACKSLGSNIQFVISEGRPKGNPQPIRISETGWYYEWCPVRDEIFAMSDMLVLRAGHVTISQAIRFAKPFVTIPIENHGEQLGNADKISRIGLGIHLNPIKLRSQQIADAISTILKDSTYQKNATRLSEFSEKLNGIDNIVNIVRTYLD